MNSTRERSCIFSEHLQPKSMVFLYSKSSLTRARLSVNPLVPQYKDVISYFEQKNINSPTLKEIREAIISIRKAKLPNHKETPNVGSYFGNPIISKEKAEALLQKFPDMPMFPYVIPAKAGIQSDKSIKLFAGWLIDKAGLKGYEKDNFGIHKDHALVIIGNGKGTLSELLEFENYIKQKVFEVFGVELVREPILVGSE